MEPVMQKKLKRFTKVGAFEKKSNGSMRFYKGFLPENRKMYMVHKYMLLEISCLCHFIWYLIAEGYHLLLRYQNVSCLT